MKQLIMGLFALGTVATTQAQPPKGDANIGDTYGAKISAADAVALSEAQTKVPETGDSVDVKIKAVVTDVCSKKGCWMKVKINDTEEAFVKMKDYDFFIPMAAIGKTIVIDGKAFVKSTSVSELKHYAQDAKKPKAEVDAITAPKKELRLLASGVVVVE